MIWWTRLVCAVNVEGEWNRCRIISFDKEIAKVYLMNVGKTISVKVDTLFCMRKINFPIPPTRLCRLRRVRSAGHPPNWSRGSVDITKEFIDKADRIHIQYYWRKLEKIEGKDCFFSYVRFYIQYLLELDGIQFHLTVLYFIKNQLVDLLNKDPVCMAYKEIMPVNDQPMRWLPSLLPALQMDEIRFLSTLFKFMYIMLRLVHFITLKQSTNWWIGFMPRRRSPPTIGSQDDSCIAR